MLDPKASHKATQPPKTNGRIPKALFFCFVVWLVPFGTQAAQPGSRPASQPTKARPSSQPAKPQKGTPNKKSRPGSPNGPTPIPVAPPCPHKESKSCFTWKECWQGHKQACKTMSAAYEYEPDLAMEAIAFSKILANQCNQKKVYSCKWLLRWYAEGIGVKQNMQHAVKLAASMCKSMPTFCPVLLRYQRKYRFFHAKKHPTYIFKRSCHWGHGASCYQWGRLLISLEILRPKQAKLAQTAFRLGCQEKHAPSCYHLALVQLQDVLRTGTGGRKRAIKPMLRACFHGLKKACEWLAKAYLYGDGPVKSCSIARALYAHLGKDSPYCLTHHKHGASSRMPRYKTTGPLGKMTRKLLSQNRTACTEGKRSACGLLGDLIAEGWETDTDPQDAGLAYEKSCTPKHQEGCTKYARWLLAIDATPQSKTKAKKLLKKACQQGSGSACVIEARRLEAQQGPTSWFVPLPAAIRKGRNQRLKRACLRSYGPACHEYARKAPPNAAKPWLKRGCSQRDGASCYLLAQQYFTHSPIHKDRPATLPVKVRARVHSLWRQGCALYDGKSCLALASVLFQRKSLRGLFPVASEALRIAVWRKLPMAYIAMAKLMLKRGEKRAHSVARNLLKRACQKHGLGVACHSWAVLKRDGEGGKWQPKSARRWFQKICKQGRAESCIAIAKMQVHGMGGVLQRANGIKALATLCKRHVPGACAPWSRALHTAKKEPSTQALHLLRRSCLHKHLDACLALHEAQSQFAKSKAMKAWRKKHFVPGTLKTLLRNKAKQGCKRLQHADCLRWAKINELGWGGAPALVIAKQAYVFACQSHKAEGCARLAKLYWQQKPKEALLLAARSCQLSGKECFKAAEALFANWRKFYKTYKRYKRYTYRSYKRYTKRAEEYRAKVLQFYKRGCTQGQARACAKLGDFAKSGKKSYNMMKKSKTKAMAFYNRACALQYKPACEALGKVTQE